MHPYRSGSYAKQHKFGFGDRTHLDLGIVLSIVSVRPSPLHCSTGIFLKILVTTRHFNCPPRYTLNLIVRRFHLHLLPVVHHHNPQSTDDHIHVPRSITKKTVI